MSYQLKRADSITSTNLERNMDEGPVKESRKTGAVRSLMKGHGFIAGDDGQNYYLHWTAMRPESKDFRDLRLRERVNFATMPNAKKDDTPRAIDVYTINVAEGEETYVRSSRVS